MNPKYKLKDGIGAVSAEHDLYLIEAFIDNGYLEKIKDPKTPQFILLGRTGAGKSAIIKYLENKIDSKRFKKIEIEYLCLQYLKDNITLRTLKDRKKNIESFYKYLWRHIFILEIVQFFSEDVNNTNSFYKFFNIQNSKNKNKAINQASQYFQKYSDCVFKNTEENIKNAVTEIEKKVLEEAQLSANISYKPEVKTDLKTSNNSVIKQKSESEFKDTDYVIDRYQISELDGVIRSLIKEFSDDQKEYYIIIDNLDKNWTYDDKDLNEIIKYLLNAIKDINTKIRDLNIKIIVSVRENIFNSVLQTTRDNEPQIEKWNDFILTITWKKQELIQLINKRLTIFKHQYQKSSPDLNDILPTEDNGKDNTDNKAIDYILNRTFQRPRDVISFFNNLVKLIDSEKFERISWEKVKEISKYFEQEIIESVIDEWKYNFPYLRYSLDLIKGLKYKFKISEINQQSINDLFNKNTRFINDELTQIYLDSQTTAIKKILECWMIVEFIEIEDNKNYIKNSPLFKKLPEDNNGNTNYIIHKCLHNTYNIKMKF
ncbi:P-loop ATPase, Sll1717 family [Pigmentibacter ruber]|uniref:P-loop ATPase, Sll1717 family n=1 Tax=Pigmentibacter ruber TaxID=2683196 RepID=UPI00131CFB13|nr:hypothetical protein [Pigmentibacter ruber]